MGFGRVVGRREGTFVELWDLRRGSLGLGRKESECWGLRWRWRKRGGGGGGLREIRNIFGHFLRKKVVRLPSVSAPNLTLAFGTRK